MKRSQSGFTLLELLLAVVLLATLMVMLADSVGLVSHRIGRSSQQVDRAGMVALVQKYLRASLGEAVPVALASDPAAGTATIDFDGGAAELDFVGRAPASAPLGGLMKFGLRFEGGKSGAPRALVIDWQPYRDFGTGDSDNGGGHTGTRQLLTGLGAVAFHYFGTPAGDRPAAWQDDWHDQGSLPSAVKVSAVFSDGEAMPDFVVALRLANPAAAPAAPQPTQ